MARLVPCGKGHKYDVDLYIECPYCRKKIGKSSVLKNAPSFVYEDPESAPTVENTTTAEIIVEDIILNQDKRKSQTRGISANPEGKTISFWADSTGNAFVTGWLVVVQGPMKGRFYPIYHEKNYLGRSHDMDIIINGDLSVVNERHCSIAYDAKYTNHFYVSPGEGVTLLNGNPLEKPSVIHSGDRLSLGQSIYEFVPFCREGHTWGKGDL